MALGYRSYHVHKISGLLLDPDFYVDFGETRTHQLRSDGLVCGYFLPEARLENPEAKLDQLRFDLGCDITLSWLCGKVSYPFGIG